MEIDKNSHICILHLHTHSYKALHNTQMTKPMNTVLCTIGADWKDCHVVQTVWCQLTRGWHVPGRVKFHVYAQIWLLLIQGVHLEVLLK